MIIIITRPYDILQVKNFFKIIPRELKIDLKSVKIIENFFIKRKLKKVQFIPKIVQFILKNRAIRQKICKTMKKLIIIYAHK